GTEQSGSVVVNSPVGPAGAWPTCVCPQGGTGPGSAPRSSPSRSAATAATAASTYPKGSGPVGEHTWHDGGRGRVGKVRQCALEQPRFGVGTGWEQGDDVGVCGGQVRREPASGGACGGAPLSRRTISPARAVARARVCGGCHR